MGLYYCIPNIVEVNAIISFFFFFQKNNIYQNARSSSFSFERFYSLSSTCHIEMKHHDTISARVTFGKTIYMKYYFDGLKKDYKINFILNYIIL